jgi:hypothetical protein
LFERILLVAGLFREKSTVGWWLISQVNSNACGLRKREVRNFSVLVGTLARFA